jgi:hypothetical protein
LGRKKKKRTRPKNKEAAEGEAWGIGPVPRPSALILPILKTHCRGKVMKRGRWLRVIGAVLAALIMAGCEQAAGPGPANREETPEGGGFVAVEGISGVPVKGARAAALNLRAARVVPENATRRSIDWILLDDGGTGLMDEELAEGLPVPQARGTLTLLAVVAGGLEHGKDYSREFSIAIEEGALSPGESPEEDPPPTEDPANPPGGENPPITDYPGDTPEEDEPPELRGLVIVSPPNLTYYALGQPFDTAGLEAAWLYSDGSTRALGSGEYRVDAVDTTRNGQRRVYLQAGEYETSFTIYISNSTRVLSGVSMDSPPAKLTYELGEDFSKTGLKLTGTYSDGTSAAISNGGVSVRNYNKLARGAQTVSISVNGHSFTLPVTVRLPPGTALSVNYYRNNGLGHYKNTYVRGEPFNLAGSGLVATARVDRYALSYQPGSGIAATELSGYQKDVPGKQTLTLDLDGNTVSYEVVVIDTEPAVWFDYGYMRHTGDPEGRGPGAGKYYARPGETLVIAPTRYLIGYDADHGSLPVSYNWTVSGGSWTTTGGGEFLHFTPQGAGTYAVEVEVRGRDYATGDTVARTAATEVVCYAAPLAAGSFTSPLRDFGPGQYTSGGNGFGWSLGALGGYEVWRVNHQERYLIEGNAFGNASGGWNEPGIVWVQEDRNGNGVPDETWYELRGSDDDDPVYRGQISRRHAIAYFNNSEYYVTFPTADRPIGGLHWVDSTGRAAFMYNSGWPGVAGNWITYTCTRIRNDGVYMKYAGSNDFGGYVDTLRYGKWTTEHFYVSDAIRADGASVTLTDVRFIKVQTAFLGYGSVYFELSTEIYQADGLGIQTNFPKP